MPDILRKEHYYYTQSLLADCLMSSW